MRTQTLRQKINSYVIPALFLPPIFSLILLFSDSSAQLIESTNRLQEVRVQQIYQFCEEQQRALLSSGLEGTPYYNNAARQQVLEKLMTIPPEEGRFMVLYQGGELISNQQPNVSELLRHSNSDASDIKESQRFSYIDSDGDKSFAVVRFYEPWGWTLVSTVKRKAVLESLSIRVYLAAGATLLVLVVVLLYFFVVTQRLIRPFRNMVKSVAAFGEGHLECRVERDALYELDMLGQSFNAMAEKIEAYSSQQEERIKESNQALSTTRSELESSHQKLLESEKLAALGRILIGISHEMNTPLGTAIVANSSLMERLHLIEQQIREKQGITQGQFTDLLEHSQKASELICSSLTRAVSLINSFRECSAQSYDEKQVEFRLRNLIEDTLLQNQQQLIELDIQVLITGHADLVVKSYPGLFSIVLNALMKNAVQHGLRSGPGQIEIRYFKETDKLTLEVSDNGCGLPEELKENIFEPFSTGNLGYSTGLGLYMVYNLLQHIGGQIRCESELNKGCRFIVEIRES